MGEFMSQLKMIFDGGATPLPELTIQPEFQLRPALPGDIEKYNALRNSVGFQSWSADELAAYMGGKALAGGLKIVVEKSSGRFAASAAAEATDMATHPEIGVLGWVMCHPDFKGRHLGRSVSVAVMHQLQHSGYKYFSLLSDDFRLPALATYLTLGWKPWLFEEDMENRWRTIAGKLNLSFDSMGALPPDYKFI